ncbi:MAG: hypothetical protein WD772_00050 [Pseudohongiellaceae bacterium]
MTVPFPLRLPFSAYPELMAKVLGIDIGTCEKCRGPARIIACKEDPVVIQQILEHLKSKERADQQAELPPGRVPPQIQLFDN